MSCSSMAPSTSKNTSQRRSYRKSKQISIHKLNIHQHLLTIVLHREDMTPHHRLQSYFGYSFESYCTSSTPHQREKEKASTTDPPGWGGDVDTNVQWCAVVKTKLGNQRLVIGGEVDCVRGQTINTYLSRYTQTSFIDKFSGSTNSLIELKTSMTIGNARDEARFEK